MKFEEASLTEYLVKNLGPLTEANPVILAKYVVALLKKDKPVNELQKLCTDNLVEFLGHGAKSFTTKLFEALEDGSIIKVDGALDAIQISESSQTPIREGTQTLKNLSPKEENLSTSSESSSDTEDKEVSDDDDADRNHKHRRRLARPNSFETNTQEQFVRRPNKKRNKPCDNGQVDILTIGIHKEFNPNSGRNISSNFDKRRSSFASLPRAPLDLGPRTRFNQPLRGDIGPHFDLSTYVGRPIGRGRGAVPWNQHDSRFNPHDTLDFDALMASQGPAHPSLFAGTGLNAASTQNSSWAGFGFIAGMPNGIMDPLNPLGLQRTLLPTINPRLNLAMPRQRCKDFEERGFCLRGDMCPMEHGLNRIVVEDVQSLSQFNLPVSIPSSHGLGIQAGSGHLPVVPASSVQLTNIKSISNKNSKSGVMDDAANLNHIPSTSIGGDADRYDPDQPLWNNDRSGASAALLRLPSPNIEDEPSGDGIENEDSSQRVTGNNGSLNTSSSVWGRIGSGHKSDSGGKFHNMTKEDHEDALNNTRAFSHGKSAANMEIDSKTAIAHSRSAHGQPDSNEIRDSMADPQIDRLNIDGSERSPVVDLNASSMINIIENHDFTNGVHSWHSNNCHMYVASGESSFFCGITPITAGGYVIVTKRTECWQGLEQDITGKVTAGTTYPVSANVRVHGDLPGPTEVQATLKLEYPDSDIKYLFVGRISVSRDHWEKLEGSFSFTNMPNRVVFYVEGPPPGVDLLIDSVVISSSSCKQSEEITRSIDEDGNIIRNPSFEDGLNCWSARGCKILLHNAGHGKITLLHGRCFASATDRGHSWNGIQQDISGRVQRKLAYEVTAVVRILGNVNANVRASLWVQSPSGCEQYISIASVQASDKEWTRLHGKFVLNGIASKVVIYLEGPPMGTDILVNSLIVKRAKKLPPSRPPDIKGFRGNMVCSQGFHDTNILSNHDFSRGLLSWSLNSCDGYVVCGESSLLNGVTAMTGTNYAIVTNRTEAWQGLEQDITMKISAGPTYIVSAYVRVWGGQQESAPVIATLRLEYLDSPTSYIFVGRASASKERWEKLEGSFSLNNMPKHVVFFIEGPSPDHDLLIDSVEVHCSSPTHSSNGLLGVNVIDNSNLTHGLHGWSPLGSCNLSICTGSPYVLPTVARDSLSHHEPLSGRCILATNRTETWMGPSQTITNKLKLHLTYQIAAWVRVGFGACGPQHINVALGVDDQWINGGQVQCIDDRWHEVVGSFRIEKQPSKVIVYVQGPSSGVDLMVAGLYIFPVDRKFRFDHLKEKTDKVRKRDIVLKFPGTGGASTSSVSVKVRQIKNSFPFGSCINRSNIENEEFVDFFLKNFNWAVFGNELKWYSTEPEQGKYKYRDADEMIDFCIRHGIEARGHCIFWEVEDAVQPWVRSLNQNDLTTAIQNRLMGLLSRYKGKFKHYDVNNEMLHGSFYEDRLGKDIRAYMFREAHRIDPSATLFVNDYNVEDGCDSKSTPEMYIQQILDLQEKGAKVGGIGIQGHINHPVGPIVCAALDKLEILGLPIWFTELDVAASNEHVRADDLEVILREAYAHPCVEGIMLWGFWELFMCRDHSHLVDAEGDINEAGKRFLALKKEWMSHADGHVDANGEFRFRGYQGTYTVEITTPWNTSSQSFVVDKGESPLALTINL